MDDQNQNNQQPLQNQQGDDQLNPMPGSAAPSEPTVSGGDAAGDQSGTVGSVTPEPSAPESTPVDSGMPAVGSTEEPTSSPMPEEPTTPVAGESSAPEAPASSSEGESAESSSDSSGGPLGSSSV